MIRRPPTSTLFLFSTMIRRPPIPTHFPDTTPCQTTATPASATHRHGRLEFLAERTNLQEEHVAGRALRPTHHVVRSEEHTSELQSRQYLVCRLLLEKKKIACLTHLQPLLVFVYSAL